jgi:iron complex outermembrane receptor protein
MSNLPNAKNRLSEWHLPKTVLALAVCVAAVLAAPAARGDVPASPDGGVVTGATEPPSADDAGLSSIPDAGGGYDDATAAGRGPESDAGAAAPGPSVADAAPPSNEAPPVEGAPPDAGSPDELGAVVVTGVRGSRPGSVATSPTPIDVIGAEEIKNTGRVGLKEILGAIVPSFDMPALAGGGTSASVKPYALRGLSGDYLLVLVNGKRRHTTALINNLSNISGGSTPVDLDLLPAPAIGRIELLRDGAAAQYGSDAISGVLNIILDKEREGLTLTETAGSTYTQGAPLIQQTVTDGIPIGKDGFVRVAGEVRYHGASSSSAGPEPSVTAAGKPAYYYPPIAPGVPDPREASVQNYVFAGGYGRSTTDFTANGSYNSEIPIDDSSTFYSFSTLSYRNVKDARGAVTANNIASLPQIYPNGFQAYRRIYEWDWQPTVGIRTKIAGWDWDLSSGLGHDDVRLGAENTLNPSLGPASPTSFFMGKQIQNLWINNVDTSKPIPIAFLADPLQVSFGLEHRWEQFQEIAGEPNSYRNGGYIVPTGTTPFQQAFGGQAESPGLVSFTGTSPADAGSRSRHNIAGYADLWTKIVKTWGIGGAVRAEHYTDSAGDTLAGKVTTRYELLPGLAIRGGVNNGFRAPALAQTGFSTTQFTGTVVGNQEILTVSKFLPVDSPAAKALGATPLRPERSLNYTAGLSYEPFSAFRATVDAYQIYVYDRIVKTDFLGTAANGGSAIVNLLQAQGIQGVDSAQFFTNAVDTTTTGVDAVAEYTLRSQEWGTFRPSVAFSYATTAVDHVLAKTAALSGLNITLCGYQCQRLLVVATPRSKLIFNADWRIGKVHTHGRLTRYGDYTEPGTSPIGDRYFSAKWITDFEVGYDVSDHFNVAVGADNVFNVYPDKNGLVAADGSNAYGMYAPFGLTGGFYYARAEQNF